MSQRISILAVDDEPINLHTLANILEKDYDVAVATSGVKTLEIINKKRPDIILLDIHMPDMDGLELAKMIFEDELNKDIPIIFLSADYNIDIIEKGFRLGAVDYIVKPIEPKSFKLKIDLWARLAGKTIQSKQKQQLLEQYKNTLDRSVIVSKTDKNGIITYANEAFCKISGYSEEEMIGQPQNIVRHSDMDSSTFKELWKTIQSGESWSGKIKNRRKNGESYYVYAVVNPIIDSDGNLVEYIGLRHDITELEKYKILLKDELSSTSQSLEENLNYMRQYESAINEITAILKTDADNKIIYANDKFCQLMGYKFEDIVGKDSCELRAKEHLLSGDFKKIKKDLKNKKIINKMLVNISKTDEKVYFTTLFYSIIDISGNVVEHLQVMHDVTDIVKLNEEIENTQKEVVLTMGAIGETRSKETGLHVKRVAEYSYILAKLYGLDEQKANLLKQASPMHDIGKVGIPDSILNKPGKLTKEEFEIIKTHAESGYEMLKYSQRDILKTAAKISYTHHEKFDGSGYPNALKGENIPIEGRITAVADVFDALGHDRCYKKAWNLDSILELFEKEKGKHFDPQLIDMFINNLELFLEVRDTMKDKF